MGKSIEKSKDKSGTVLSPARHSRQAVGLYSRYIQMKEDNKPLIRRRAESDYDTYINPKMDVVDSEDASEKEADATTDQVMSSPGSDSDEKVQAKSLAGSINRKGQSGRSGVPVSGNTASYVNGLSGGRPLSRQERSFYEPRFGADFSTVRVHNDSKAHEAAQSINAKAFTSGNNIVFGKGQYSPDSSGGKHLMAHELTHTIQQNKGTVNRLVISRQEYEQDYAELGIWLSCHLRQEPGGEPDYGITLVNGDSAKLLDKSDDWIKIETIEGYVGWINVNCTSLSPHQDAAVENLKCQQDIDNFFHTHVLPAFETWEIALRIQGRAYFNAHKSFQQTLSDANEQAKLRADLWAAVLTTVSAGSLGFLGELATESANWVSILKSKSVRGVLEDAIQTGLGETIDLAQGGWYSPVVNSETHPEEYLNTQLIALADVRRQLTINIGSIKETISHDSDIADRVGVLLSIFEWWNEAQLKHTPLIDGSKEVDYRNEIEIGFWQDYILQNLFEIIDRDHTNPYEAGMDDIRYSNPENAIKDRFDDLEITQMAGIDGWQNAFQRFFTNWGETEDGLIYSGPDNTHKLVTWARSHNLNEFE